MPDLRVFLASAPVIRYSGTVYRICPARYEGNVVSMRGSLLFGARYNIRGYFGALYTSCTRQGARQEVARYFTVPPIGGFAEATIKLRLSRVVDFTDATVLRRAETDFGQLIESRFTVTQEIGLRAWEGGIEALIVPSAANPGERNVAVFLDNQRAGWRVELVRVSAAGRVE